jgi:hypothetical protein
VSLCAHPLKENHSRNSAFILIWLHERTEQHFI